MGGVLPLQPDVSIYATTFVLPSFGFCAIASDEDDISDITRLSKKLCDVEDEPPWKTVEPIIRAPDNAVKCQINQLICLSQFVVEEFPVIYNSWFVKSLIPKWIALFGFVVLCRGMEYPPVLW
jgi:hypothetical protein